MRQAGEEKAHPELDIRDCAGLDVCFCLLLMQRERVLTSQVIRLARHTVRRCLCGLPFSAAQISCARVGATVMKSMLLLYLANAKTVRNTLHPRLFHLHLCCT